MLDQVKNGLARLGRWVASKRMRIIWLRLLLLIILYPLSGLLAVVWRIMLSGSAADQALIIYATITVMVIRNGWREWRGGGDGNVRKSDQDPSDLS